MGILRTITTRTWKITECLNRRLIMGFAGNAVREGNDEKVKNVGSGLNKVLGLGRTELSPTGLGRMDDFHETALYGDAAPGPHDHIYVAMSSGVDSSTVAALMAKSYPNRVTGIYMCNWSSSAKCTEAEWNDVQKVCQHLKIPAHRVNFEKDYWTQVFEPMINMYSKGLTPNPDVTCNRTIKFGSLVDYLRDREKTDNWKLATGHYARVNFDKTLKKYQLLRPNDRKKDQSYYLSSVLPSVLEKIIFPLGRFTKLQVREMAVSFGLPTAYKPDSQGLCFVSQDQRRFRKFLSEYINPQDGDVVTEDGDVVGRHQGLWSATIGQRSFISMPQADPKCRGIWYVSDKNIEKNQLVIVHGQDHPSLFKKRVICEDFKILDDTTDFTDFTSIQAQYRSLQNPEPLSSLKLQRSEKNKLSVEFSNPRRAVAPGQYLVLYNGQKVLGSGIINAVS